MARGVDSVAHKAVVQARGRTVAVFGTGVDVIYPRENRKLAEQILELAGALVSEFPLATSPSPHNFPLRIALSAAFPAASWSWRPVSSVAPASPPAAPSSSAGKSSPFPETSPTNMPGLPTPSSSREPNSSPPGKMSSRNSPPKSASSSSSANRATHAAGPILI